MYNASVIDIFCGAGGLSHGFKLEGFPIACGIDIDNNCRHAFEKNNATSFITHDLANFSGSMLASKFHHGAATKILVGCAPCQPFSPYNQKKENPQWGLVGKFANIIKEARPEIVSMENVPHLLKFKNGSIFSYFINTLEKTGYALWYGVVNSADYGVPQSRKRLVLLASLLGDIELEKPTHCSKDYLTVKHAIGNLPALDAGKADKNDALHRSADLLNINLKRIRSSRPGGTWKDWSESLQLSCHRRLGDGYKTVYGRMEWDKPSPTLTAGFYKYSCGRFGHPEQDRAISIREGALLQTFPKDYDFFPPDKKFSLDSLARMIGNAVPVNLARAIACSIKHHLLQEG